eukprot:1527780-Rhodomonas_salina.2
MRKYHQLMNRVDIDRVASPRCRRLPLPWRILFSLCAEGSARRDELELGLALGRPIAAISGPCVDSSQLYQVTNERKGKIRRKLWEGKPVRQIGAVHVFFLGDHHFVEHRVRLQHGILFEAPQRLIGHCLDLQPPAHDNV